MFLAKLSLKLMYIKVTFLYFVMFGFNLGHKLT